MPQPQKEGGVPFYSLSQLVDIKKKEKSFKGYTFYYEFKFQFSKFANLQKFNLPNFKSKSSMLKAKKYRFAYANLIHATNTPCVFLWIIIYLLPMVIYQFYMVCEWQKAKAMTYFQATKSINFWEATKNELVFVLNAKWNKYKNVKMIKMDLFKQELICTSYYEKIETI